MWRVGTSMDVENLRLGPLRVVFFFFNDTATTEIYTLSLHDALPILLDLVAAGGDRIGVFRHKAMKLEDYTDRKSTRLNSSHSQNSYAVFCLKKKKTPGA